MKKTRSRLVLLLRGIICILYAITRSSTAASDSNSIILLGVSPQDETYYMGLLSSSSPLATIKCKDGSKKFSKSQLNDDFCDCPDASDEPGTSACPNGKFYCRNPGHVPLHLYSSRVNDGVCDCCDGSDEYDGKIKCPNTCWVAGEVARDKLKKKIATYQEGVTIRKRELEQAKAAIAREEAELSKLQNEEKILRGLVEQLKERKELIEKAEEKEQLQKEKEEKQKKEAEEANLKEKQTSEQAKTSEEEAVEVDNQDTIGLLEDSPSPQDEVEGHDNHEGEPLHGHHTIEEEALNSDVELVEKEHLRQAAEKDEEFTLEDKPNADTGEHLEKEIGNTEALSREELGRLVASRWTGEKTEQQNEEVSSSKDENENHGKQEEDSYEEEYNGYGSEDDEQRYNHDEGDNEDQIDDFGGEDHDDSRSSDKSDSDDDFDISDIIGTIKSSWLDKLQKTVQSVLQAINLFQTPVNKSEAARVRKEYEESNAKLSKLQSKRSSLSQKLKHDFGPEKEFYSFYGQCFEKKENKYVYKLCPYKQASQVEGHSTTRLGNWEKFEDSYKVLQFSNGDKCWNGPDRSIKVKLRCGLKNEITDVDEPSRCEYLALMSTPALCQEEKMKELQDKLDAMNREQPRHDEL